MKKERSAVFDYQRAIAIIGIVCSHFFFNYHETMGLGRCCACTFNVLFIAMSGLLLGMSWERDGYPVYKLDFLKHRFKRIIVTYYPFLVLMFLFLKGIAGYEISIKDMLMHIMFLPWFDKMPGFGHLWFLTMIAFCYVAVYIFAKRHKGVLVALNGGGNLFLNVIALIAVVVIHFFCELKGLPGQMILYLGVFLMCFLYAKVIVGNLEKWGWNFFISSLIILSIIIALFFYGLYDTMRPLAECLGVISAGLVMALIIKIFKGVRPNKVAEFVAGISFEIYLVHHNFAFGRYSIPSLVGNPVVGLCALLVFSIVSAWLLKRFCGVISLCLGNIRRIC